MFSFQHLVVVAILIKHKSYPLKGVLIGKGFAKLVFSFQHSCITFGFMLGRFITEAIFLLRCLMEKYRESGKVNANVSLVKVEVEVEMKGL